MGKMVCRKQPNAPRLARVLASVICFVLLATAGRSQQLALQKLRTFDGSDGANPEGLLILTNGTLYGTTYGLGTPGLDEGGTVFRIDTDGSGFAILHHFNKLSGMEPASGLAFSSNMLFGTAAQGGAGEAGTLFQLDILTGRYQVLHNFASSTNDGVFPVATLEAVS